MWIEVRRDEGGQAGGGVNTLLLALRFRAKKYQEALAGRLEKRQETMGHVKEIAQLFSICRRDGEFVCWFD